MISILLSIFCAWLKSIHTSCTYLVKSVSLFNLLTAVTNQYVPVTIPSRFPSNSKANASEFLENQEIPRYWDTNLFTRYYFQYCNPNILEILSLWYCQCDIVNVVLSIQSPTTITNEETCLQDFLISEEHLETYFIGTTCIVKYLTGLTRH